MVTPPAPCLDAPMRISDDDLMTIHEVAERFRVHWKTVYRWLAEGSFPCHAVKVERQWRVSRSSVDSFLSGPDA